MKSCARCTENTSHGASVKEKQNVVNNFGAWRLKNAVSDVYPITHDYLSRTSLGAESSTGGDVSWELGMVCRHLGVGQGPPQLPKLGATL